MSINGISFSRCTIICAARRALTIDHLRSLMKMKFLVPIVLLLLMLGSASAYNDDGHFYTAVSTFYSRLPPYGGRAQEAAILIGFCAQLPDLAKEFDAISLRVREAASFNGMLWGLFSACRDEDVCHMVTVHHYLHALTDSDSQSVTKAAIRTLEELVSDIREDVDFDRNRACAAGFAMHLLGDSFAHRRIKDPTRMYPPGMGHYRDDHNPDFILFNEERSANFVTYAQELDKAIKSSSAKTRLQKLKDALREAREGADLDNLYNEKYLRKAFLNSLKTEDARLWAPYDPPVESNSDELVLSRSCKQILGTYKIDKVNCNEVWRIFKSVAIPSFEKENIKPTCPEDKAWIDGVSK